MKIGGYGNIQDLIKTYQKKKPDEQSRDVAVINKGQDTLEISVKAQEIQEIQAALKNDSGIRNDKVQKIREDIAKGQYKIDADKIAEGIARERILDRQV